MLSRTLRRAVLDTRWSLPPPYLLPWTANLSTESHGATTSSIPPSSLSSEIASQTQTPSQSPPQTTSSPHPRKPSKASPPALSPSVKALLPHLTAQRQIYITAHIHARPYLLTQGDTLRLPFLMPGVQPGDILRFNRATTIGSRDFTLRAPGSTRRGKSEVAGSGRVPPSFPGASALEGAEGTEVEGPAAVMDGPDTEHFVPHLAKGRIKYLDDRLFVCRAVVTGIESEPMRIMEKTKRRQRHTRHVKSKHRYTVLRIREVKVRGVEEVESGEIE
ncbi:Homocitrate dehydratase, mitochondrial [Sphaceloma murrayae]|uniref:Large ribosomal subunit protein bL21m n=1 Tax=Sphaceloma murrayae TaxID=2082308 RepID=A0A2K1QU98_9PEZI|nr:Homocitrate dehydratase, mitochondrial [Sphaceloma murrayae]